MNHMISTWLFISVDSDFVSLLDFVFPDFANFASIPRSSDIKV